ncbi:MAG: hypothetical protein ACLGH0_07175 [Thermoanaerobaculia bacterium]
MHGCARSCLLQLAVWAAFAGAFFLLETHWVVAVVGGLFAALATLMAAGAIKAARERRMLLSAMLGSLPPDGRWVAVSGTISTLSPMQAPLSGATVSAYEYKILNDQQPYIDGKGLASSTIGSIRLLSVPQLEVEPVALDRAKAIANATEHIRRATFERRDTSKQRTAALEKEWTDDDGVFRIDKRYYDTADDLASFRFEEKHIRPGDAVCAFGFYSRERGGLVPDSKWGRHTRLMRGRADEVAGRLRARMIRFSVATIVFAILAYSATQIPAYSRTKPFASSCSSAVKEPLL